MGVVAGMVVIPIKMPIPTKRVTSQTLNQQKVVAAAWNLAVKGYLGGRRRGGKVAETNNPGDPRMERQQTPAIPVEAENRD